MNTRVGSPPHLQHIFPAQELNWGLLHCRWILYQLSYQRSPSTHTQAQSNKNKITIPWVSKYGLTQVKQVSFMQNYTQILIY